MSSTNAPFGLRPSFHPSGLDRAVALADGIVSGYTSNILKGPSNWRPLAFYKPPPLAMRSSVPSLASSGLTPLAVAV